MVQAFSPERADQALAVRILPGAVRSCEDFFDAQRRDASAYLLAVDAVPVAKEESGRVPIGEGFDNLLRGPDRGRMIRNAKVQYLAPAMFQHEEHEQHL